MAQPSAEEARSALQNLSDRYTPDDVRDEINGVRTDIPDDDRRQINVAADILGTQAALDVVDSVAEQSGGGQVGLAGFDPERADRITGRVINQADLLDPDFVLESAGEMPGDVEQAAVDAVRSALGDMMNYVPFDTDVATLVYNKPNDEIESFSVTWDPAATPPQRIGDFEYRGETTPSGPNVDPVDLGFATRYSYCGPPTEQIPINFSVPEREQPIDTSSTVAAVPGPIAGTIKPSPSSVIIQKPNGDVVGIDTSVSQEESMCLWIEVVEIVEPRIGKTGDWTLMYDIRPENKPNSVPGVGVMVPLSADVPGTRTGAFQAAFELMAGNNPRDPFIHIVDAIEANPDIVREGLRDDLQTIQDVEGITTEGEQKRLGGPTEVQARIEAEETPKGAQEGPEKEPERNPGGLMSDERDLDEQDPGEQGSFREFGADPTPEQMEDDDEDEDEPSGTQGSLGGFQ